MLWSSSVTIVTVVDDTHTTHSSLSTVAWLIALLSKFVGRALVARRKISVVCSFSANLTNFSAYTTLRAKTWLKYQEAKESDAMLRFLPSVIPRVGKNHISNIYGLYTAILAGIWSNWRSHTVYIYGSGQSWFYPAAFLFWPVIIWVS